MTSAGAIKSKDGIRGAEGFVQRPVVSFHPETLMKINSLELRARMVVEGFMAGLHRSPYHGFSVEFTDYRAYSPGDDLRYLDWRLLARTDRRFIKRFEDETNLRCYLVLDNSRSMQFGSLAYSKADYAKTLAATLAYFFAHQRDAVGLVLFDEKIKEYIQPRFRPGHLRRLLIALQNAPDGTGTDISGPLEQLAKTFRKRGLVVLISDILTPISMLQKKLAYLRSLGHEVILLRVLDPLEMSFEFRDPKMFVDMESRKTLYVDPVAVRQSYLKKFAEHASELRVICRDLGIELHPIEMNRPLDQAMFEVLSSRFEKSSTRPHRRPRILASEAKR